MIFFDEVKWNKNVTQYNLIKLSDNEVLETKNLVREDAALLNIVYNRDKRDLAWTEIGPSAKKNRKTKK